MAKAFPLRLHLLAIALLLPCGSVVAFAQKPSAKAVDARTSICPLVESVARSNSLPIEFFVRLIWRESHFRPDVLGPLTSSGERAQGVAQFMPSTAAEQGLFDPFDPVEAVPKSGAFLAELRDEFGNLGLAAAAYNAGPQRVRDFLAGTRDLPTETRNYVLAITGHPIEDWVSHVPEPVSKLDVKNPIADDCEHLTTFLKQESLRTADAQPNVPAWCHFLHHPSVAACGSVHERNGLMPALSHTYHLRRRARILRTSLR